MFIVRKKSRITTHLELDRPRLVLVEYVKHVVCELGRIAKREELPVDLLELCHEDQPSSDIAQHQSSDKRL